MSLIPRSRNTNVGIKLAAAAAGSLTRVAVDRAIDSLSSVLRGLGSSRQPMSIPSSRKSAPVPGAPGKRRRRRKQNAGSSLARTLAPVAVAPNPSPTFMRAAGRPQQRSTVGSFTDGTRVHGRSWCHGVTVQQPIVGQTYGLSCLYNSAGNQIASQYLTPSVIDYEHLQALQANYAWYAIRALRVTYMPAVGTNTAGQFALGLTNNVAVVGGLNTGTINEMGEVMGLQFAQLFTPWQEKSFDYRYDGEKVFSAVAGNSGGNQFDNYQLNLLGMSLAYNSTALAQWGSLMFDYVVDFYEPLPYYGTVPTLTNTSGGNGGARDTDDDDVKDSGHKPMSDSTTLASVLLRIDSRLSNLEERANVVQVDSPRMVTSAKALVGASAHSRAR